MITPVPCAVSPHIPFWVHSFLHAGRIVRIDTAPPYDEIP